MPQPYNDAVLTDAGLALSNRAQAGEATLRFTRMVTGDGAYTASEKAPSALRKRTGLKAQKNSYTLSSAHASADGVRLTSLITNQNPVTGEALVSEGYHINEIGLYAEEKDGGSDTEVLYSIAVAAGDNGDYMPPYNGGMPAQIVQEYRAKVSAAAEVSISCAGAALLAEEKGIPGGVATLGADGRVPAGQLPAASSLGIVSTRLDTVLPAAWDGADAPFTQTIAAEGVAEGSIVDMDVSGDVTAEELDAYIAAKIVDGGQGDGQITLKAFGEKPAIPIPVKIVVRKV